MEDSIQDLCTMRAVEVADLTTDEKEKLQDAGFDIEDGEETVYICETDCARYLHDSAWYNAPTEWDGDELNCILDNHLNNADAYVVIGGFTPWGWNGNWHIFRNKEDILDRDYDTTDYILGSNGLAMVLSEASHDCPTGALMYVIGITEAGVRQLEAGNIRYGKDLIRRRIHDLDAKVF